MTSEARTLAIGDIHGSHTALVTLLHEIRPTVQDKAIFLGDYIDRGPASRQVIEILLELRSKTQTAFLRGNHEVMILESREDPLKESLWRGYGGAEMLQSYGAEYSPNWISAIPEAHWQFFEGTKRFIETNTHIFVHACLDSDLDMKDQSDRMLFWEFFEQIQRHKSGKKIVCGHSPSRSGEIKDVGFAVCIDTGPAVGGWLTCLDVNSGEYWQATEKGLVRNGLLSSSTDSQRTFK
jgi:serine/threonine protein phosphatase 1